MDPELVRLVFVNAPNYLGFWLLYRQQSRIIDRLLRIINHWENDDESSDTTTASNVKN